MSALQSVCAPGVSAPILCSVSLRFRHWMVCAILNLKPGGAAYSVLSIPTGLRRLEAPPLLNIAVVEEKLYALKALFDAFDVRGVGEAYVSLGVFPEVDSGGHADLG